MKKLYRRWKSPLASAPGPWYTKWTSLVLSYHWLSGNRAHHVERLHKKYGSTVRISPYEMDFASVNAVRQIYSFKRPFLKAEFYDHLRDHSGYSSVFDTRDPIAHSRYRRLLANPLSETGLKSFEPLISDKVDLAIDRIGQEIKQKGFADILKWWMFMATDVIGELSFGDSFRMLDQGKSNQYVDDLAKVGFMSGIQAGFPKLFALANYVPLPVISQAKAINARLTVYGQQSIQRYEKMVMADPWNVRPTLFTKFFKAGEEGLSQGEIISNAKAYIVAGSDTTAITLSYLMYSVCKDEQVKARLIEEVSALAEGYQDGDLKQLSYLSQVIRETTRLYAAAPSGMPRDAPPEGCEIDGYYVPRGTTVSTQPFSMHRNPTVYPEPERFDPSRWEKPTKDMNDAWMPFGAGSRVCIGTHLAYMELRLATVKFFRAFPNVRLSKKGGFGDSDMDSVIFFLMTPKGKRCHIELS
ncbi:cytochrome protein [Corynespora cassiicola Philippines]|uniref:Cytochrome protein n=1 Tax=Corynespora cassiicola Philippines TaxID=1448308 RepID=A0A2T2NSM1_CORCC|nr:cytochrome protein [Corynespora cassiicola Philippines]